MYPSDKLLKQIEFLRQQMTSVALEKGFTDIESIEISQELDRLLNIYETMKDNETMKCNETN
ncbi:stage 0 sporulation regulatory protein [Virgibacillus natechei]|uniref:Stage 0 sporulation regulatory protein n=1 Tax=Virgibacillus natechei TaxID=1216297 RepID=A0ABS4IC95_9BACI|nr:aspartyl-phosphate phosphatase Spo0E family protein [Virgibacillus natechei]MBP1968270.1 stage 0 sporulation regulatory protein [Virgibacillus natechei]UZD14464.1 aspartyl-phosphate phosphatase Spo0E family protein [Virgibacillus natechei]